MHPWTPAFHRPTAHGSTQHPTAYDTGRILGSGLVEHGGRRGTPVDHDDVTILVAYTDATDVAGLAIEEIEPAEHQSVVGGIQRGDPLGRLEHHGVTLDEAAFVADVAAGITLRDQCLCHLPGRLQALVDIVDIGLFGS